MDKYIGKVLADRYEIHELIGIGGMAYVYRGFDRAENRVAAIKILKDEYLANEEFIRRFRNESRAIALLSHPNIVKIYDVLFSEYMQIIVMEYVDGITLKEYIEHQHILKWKEVVHFTVQILRALQHAHDKGIVHRDIKPQNIMLLQDGTIKVMDFGIARFSRSEPQTMTDKAIGSVHYISPEQARGDPIDEKTDIYSVGVMLYEMLTGQLPFEGESPVSVALKQIQDPPKKPRELNPGIPKGLEYITLHAMQKDPARRYQSAAEMLRDLDEFKRDPNVVFPEEEVLAGYQQTRTFQLPEMEDPDYEEAWEKKSAVVPVLLGILFAFVLATGLFVVGVLWINNPFEAVGDFEMPYLIGLDYDRACEQYPELDIIVTERGYSEEYEKGQIYRQNPKGGRSVKENAVITVSVSDGVRIIDLPDLVELDAELAEKTLRDYDLVPIVTDEVSADVPVGQVIRTNPEAHTELRPGDTVEIVVSASAEAEKTTVPQITDMSVSDAMRVLEAYGLKLGTQNPVKSDKPAGTIVGQGLDPDTEVREGTAVDVDVSTGVSDKDEDDGELRRLIVPITLPSGGSLPDSYRLQVIFDQEEIINDVVAPDRYPDGIYRMTVENSGTKEYTVLINGYSYIKLEVYFSSASFAVTEGKAGSFDFDLYN